MTTGVELGRGVGVTADLKGALATGFFFTIVGFFWFFIASEPTTSFVLLLLVSGFGLVVTFSAVIRIARRAGRSLYLVRNRIEVWRHSGKRTATLDLAHVMDFFYEPVSPAIDNYGFLRFRTQDGRSKSFGPLKLEADAEQLLGDTIHAAQELAEKKEASEQPTALGPPRIGLLNQTIEQPPPERVQPQPAAQQSQKGFSFFDAVRNYWSNYANFNGRARRAEFWFTVLFLTVAAFIVAAIDTALFLNSGLLAIGGVFGWAWLAATLVPTLAQTVRRLHDAGFSGWLVLLYAVPILGWIALFVMFVMDSRPEDNRWGPSPKALV